MCLFRFGSGYYVTIRVSSRGDGVAPVAQFIKENFPTAELRECHHNTIEYQLSSGENLSSIFGRIEEAREKLHIDDYSVCQTTLDQVLK